LGSRRWVEKTLERIQNPEIRRMLKGEMVSEEAKT
jgi:hypothetical protein